MLDRFFGSIYWRLIAVFIVTLLFVWIGHLVLVAHYSISLYSTQLHTKVPEFSAFLDSVYRWGIFAIVLLMMILLAGIVDLIRSYSLTKQYQRITQTITHFAEGDFSKRIQLKGVRASGLQRLMASFNDLADSVVANIAELQKIDQQRRELVANVAHDLGTPLTSIHGYVETILLKDAQLSAEERSKYLNVIMDNTRALGLLVNELFDLSTFDRMEISPRFEPFSIHTLASDVASRFEPLAEEQKVAIEIEAPALPLVRGDVALVERVLTNIFKNSLLHTPAGGTISVSFEVRQQHVATRVADSGCGIPEKDLPFVFERFFRVQKDRSRKTGGAGLGLAIVKKILEAHGSVYSLTSKEGVGTVFEFYLAKASH